MITVDSGGAPLQRDQRVSVESRQAAARRSTSLLNRRRHHFFCFLFFCPIYLVKANRTKRWRRSRRRSCRLLSRSPFSSPDCFSSSKQSCWANKASWRRFEMSAVLILLSFSMRRWSGRRHCEEGGVSLQGPQKLCSSLFNNLVLNFTTSASAPLLLTPSCRGR